MKTPELKPCPACGEKPGLTYLCRSTKTSWKQLVMVEISHACKGVHFMCQSGTIEGAEDAWNRRATDENT